jgi:LCP family protein required for cell wall assembly
MMILTLNENTKKIHITSLSRAIYVSIPDEPSPGMEPYLMTEYMLNAAHSWGGARLLMRTIERNFRIQLDGYFEVGFDGFSQVIDTIGGIDLELTAAEADYLNTHVPGYGFYEGYNRLYGEAALHYARIRKIDSDFARMDRQRYVIETLLREALNSGTGQMLDVMQAVLPLVTTDVSGGEITGLIMKAPQYINYEIDQLRIPIDGTGEVVYINSMEMWDIDWVTNINRLHEFMSE